MTKQVYVYLNMLDDDHRPNETCRAEQHTDTLACEDCEDIATETYPVYRWTTRPTNMTYQLCGACLTLDEYVRFDPRYVAQDGARITHDARMFNYYDGVYVTIIIEHTPADLNDLHHDTWDGWFNTQDDNGRSILLNNERLAGQPPAWMRKKGQ